MISSLSGFAKCMVVGWAFMTCGHIAGTSGDGVLHHAFGLAFSIGGYGLLMFWFSEKTS